MQTFDYSILENTLIEGYDLIIPKYSVVYKYCYKNNIRTIAELIFKYDNGEIHTLNKKTIAEIFGFIELVIYRHFNIDLLQTPLLFDKIKVCEDMWNGKYRKDWTEVRVLSNNVIFPIRRLGFSTIEENKIKSFVAHKKEDMLIINAIMNYKNDPKKHIIKGNKKAQYVFEKKIDIILDYYNKKYLSCVNSDRMKYLSELIYRYKDISEKKQSLDKELMGIVNKLEEEKNILGERCIKKVLKLHEIDNIF